MLKKTLKDFLIFNDKIAIHLKNVNFPQIEYLHNNVDLSVLIGNISSIEYMTHFTLLLKALKYNIKILLKKMSYEKDQAKPK